MKCSIFIKSWRNDLNWLCYCLRFLEVNWNEPDTEVVLVLDEDCRGEVQWEAFHLDSLVIHYIEPWPDGYCGAMYQKTLADQYCEGELILMVDSDSMLLELSTLADYMKEDRALIAYVTYEEHLKEYPHSPWQRVTQRLIKEPVHLHYMGWTPMLYHRSSFSGMRNWISELHGEPYAKVVYSDVRFDPKQFMYHPISLFDFDLLGCYAHRFETDRYDFKHLSEMPPNKWTQFHSWTQCPEELGLHRRLQATFSQRLASVLHRNGAPHTCRSAAKAQELTLDQGAGATVLDPMEQSGPSSTLSD